MEIIDVESVLLDRDLVATWTLPDGRIASLDVGNLLHERGLVSHVARHRWDGFPTVPLGITRDGRYRGVERGADGLYNDTYLHARDAARDVKVRSSRKRPLPAATDDDVPGYLDREGLSSTYANRIVPVLSRRLGLPPYTILTDELIDGQDVDAQVEQYKERKRLQELALDHSDLRFLDPTERCDEDGEVKEVAPPPKVQQTVCLE